MMAPVLSELPAVPPPPGVTPDFDPHLAALQPIAIAIAAVFLVLTTSTLAARMAAKRLVLHVVQIEDCKLLVPYRTCDEH